MDRSQNCIKEKDKRERKMNFSGYTERKGRTVKKELAEPTEVFVNANKTLT